MFKDRVGGSAHAFLMSADVYLKKNNFRNRCGSMANITEMNQPLTVPLGARLPQLVPQTGLRYSPISDVALGHPSLMLWMGVWDGMALEGQ